MRSPPANLFECESAPIDFLRGLPWVPIGKGLRACVLRVSPQMAVSFLDLRHENQRALSEAAVKSYEIEVRAGRFLLTHQGICFDLQWSLIDGQHRLEAIARGQESVEILVFQNESASIRDPIDVGRKRTVAYLTQRSQKMTAILAALRSIESGSHVTHAMTTGEADEVFSRHSENIESLFALVPPLGKALAGFVAGCTWTLPIARNEVIDFATKSMTGEMVSRGDPAFAFRNWKEGRQFQSDAWHVSLATLNCLSAQLSGERLAVVFTGETGFRRITSRRRALKIPNTPSVDLVPPVSGIR